MWFGGGSPGAVRQDLSRISALICALTLGIVPAFAARAADTVVITVEGMVRPSCGLAFATGAEDASLTLGDIDAPGNRTFAFRYSCNAGFQLEVVSSGGGLRPGASSVRPPAGFASVAPYRLALTLPLDNGGALNLDCESQALNSASDACRRLSSGGVSGIAKTATGQIAWPGLTHDAPAIAGAYADTLTIRMTPQL